MSIIRNNTIVIYGQYKTGTTGLFYKIKNSLPRDTRTLFEQLAYIPMPEDANRAVLAKVILEGTEGTVNYPSFAGFKKQIYIVRDPRDWVVSGTLFIVQQNSACYSNPKRLESILSLLRQKENDPRSVSVVQLLRLIITENPDGSLEPTVQWIRGQQQWLLEFEARLDGAHGIRYEDFVDDDLRTLEDYLEFPLTGDAEVMEEHDHVVRTKSSGSWRHWFLDEDIDFFRPLLQRYIVRHDYDGNWDVSERPSIQPEHCSLYVARAVRKRLEPSRQERS